MEDIQSIEVVEPPVHRSLYMRLKGHVPEIIKLASKARLRKSGRIGLNLPDRVFLEKVVIPWFVERDDVQSVLDVGTDWYTWRYDRLFPNMQYHSIDFDAAKARFASKNHITGSILELDQYYEVEKFDLIICNGVFGWGVDSREDIATALQQFTRSLKPGGFLVVGWNDSDGHRPEGFSEPDLEGFEPFWFPPLRSDFYRSPNANRHQFRFYRSQIK